MNITDKSIRFIVVIMVVLILFGLGFTSFASEKQDEKFANDQAMYHQALQYIQSGENDKALLSLKKINLEYPTSTSVKYYTGLALLNNGEVNSAVNEFQRLIEINPYMIEDSIFMIVFARALVSTEKFEDAKLVLERCKTLQIPEEIPDYLEQVNELLTLVTKSS